MHKKIGFLIFTIIIMFICFPLVVFAEGEVYDFTIAIGNESGVGWNWDNDSKVLTLSGAKINKGIKLPEGSFINVVKGTSNTISVSGVVPITVNGALTIKGSGSLLIETPVVNGSGFHTFSGITSLNIEDVSLTTSGLSGLMAENVSIKNSKLDIYGYRYGIYAMSNVKDKNVFVNLVNCTGKITGSLLQGIEVVNGVSGDVSLDIEKSNDLVITGNTTNKRLSSVFDRSGARLYTMGSASRATVNIKDSKGIKFYGTNTGIAIDCHFSSSDANGKNSNASLIIENSEVLAETITSTWSAFFINNNGIGSKDSASIIINKSKVSALAPNDVAIMTSTKGAPSSVTIRNSVVELAGLYAGIRAKSNITTDAEIFVIEDSLVVVVDKIGKNYKVLDEMDKAVSSDGLNGVDKNSKVVSPKDCTITLKPDGSWDIPDDGTILVNGEESNFTYGGVIEPTGEILPYITSVNDSEFVDLNKALASAKEGDNVILLIPTSKEDVILPVGVTLTSPVSIPVKTNDYGYKVVEKLEDDKYVYSVVPLTKFKVVYHFNHGKEKTVIREVFEGTNFELEKNVFNAPKEMEFVNWTIDGKQYKSGDKYLVNNDVHVYAEWKKIENPDTYDGVGLAILASIVSSIVLGANFMFSYKFKDINN